MKRSKFVPFGVLFGVAVAVACSKSGSKNLGFDPHGDAGLSPAKMGQILNAAQQVTDTVPQAELVAQGKQLFESTKIARKGESCATCHVNGGGVNQTVGIIHHPTKDGDFTGNRTVIPLWGVAHTAPYTWHGGAATLQTQVTNTIKNFFNQPSPAPKDVAALTAYLSSLEPPRTDFDNGTMSALALQGEALFRGKAGCAGCHSGPLFTDNRIHDIGVPKAPGDTDPGAANPPGGFNTPMLRDVKNRQRFMHNGAFSSLQDVLSFYNGNKLAGVPSLGGPERDALVAYLESL